MTEPASLRQAPTDESLIANGDPLDALHWVDRIDAGISGLTKQQAVSALRYWIGEAEYWKREAEK
jgi:hypothetical protein